jgi:hypothetical protein
MLNASRSNFPIAMVKTAAYSEELPIIRRFWRVVFGQRLAVNPQLARKRLERFYRDY